MALLETRDLTISFGGLMAVANVNLAIERGELVGLIGPNGAGKTTVFNLLTGVYRPTRGRLFLTAAILKGLSLTRLPVRGLPEHSRISVFLGT